MLEKIIPNITSEEEAIYFSLKNAKGLKSNSQNFKYLIFLLLVLIILGSLDRENAPLLIFASIVLFGMQLENIPKSSGVNSKEGIVSLMNKIDQKLNSLENK
jgi:hypothetical protein